MTMDRIKNGVHHVITILSGYSMAEAQQVLQEANARLEVMKGKPVTLTSLSPPTASIRGVNFTISVHGNNFDPSAVIVWGLGVGGGDEPTTFVSDTELTTGVVPSVVSSPTTIPVQVRQNGVLSDPLDFVWTA